MNLFDRMNRELLDPTPIVLGAFLGIFLAGVFIGHLIG